MWIWALGRVGYVTELHKATVSGYWYISDSTVRSRKPPCTYKRCWKWCPRASIQAWTCFVLFTNTFCRSACEMYLMNKVIAVSNSLSVPERLRYTADFAAPHRSRCTVTFQTHCIMTWHYVLYCIGTTLLLFICSFLNVTDCTSYLCCLPTRYTDIEYNNSSFKYGAYFIHYKAIKPNQLDS
jgi:hypothetical protein